MKTRHLLQLVLLSALWGASFLFIRVASPVLGPNVTAALRIGLATLTLAGIMRATREPWPWRHWRELTGLGIMTVALPFLLYAWAALRLPAGYSSLLNTMVVPFGVLASAWMKEDTLSLRKWLGCLFGFLGVAFIVRLGPVNPTPELVWAALACVGAAACYGICTPWMKRSTQRISPLAIAAGIHATALVMLLPGAAWDWPQARFTAPALAAVLVMGVVTSGLAYWLNLRVLSQISPVAAMSSAFMIPLFGVTWGHLFLGESLGPGIWWGGALVLLATALVTGFNPLRILVILRKR
ncbi:MULTISPECIES: DMT family transporter [unclassified Simplicispira]|uniref:DMT family transporter n=1 Tax=unclassified Simplicispira TaxID=2630407 RepID=UPI000D5F436C|nr:MULTISPECIES: DMT family transporter [unclassified Simplicispira]MBH1977251.1 DMT family transporter [Comamonadaceae bacterium]PVY56106.1 threonine/homoserine efflux transporter RhtA [Simplicispira sp. 125]REG17051.1 threonine/homoserine efflux transporter RhtA [Simplicispira sp. 110]